jgi:hypothetical protein
MLEMTSLHMLEREVHTLAEVSSGQWESAEADSGARVAHASVEDSPDIHTDDCGRRPHRQSKEIAAWIDLSAGNVADRGPTGCGRGGLKVRHRGWWVLQECWAASEPWRGGMVGRLNGHRRGSAPTLRPGSHDRPVLHLRSPLLGLDAG